jgi:hypothetical protein
MNEIKNIDKIFIITLDTSIERQNNIKQRFPELLQSSLFEWFITKRDTENPERGCWNSHKTVINIAKQRNYSRIIVMEDDADLLVSWNFFCDFINKIDYDSLDNSWTTISLGYFPILSKVESNLDGLVEIICAAGATGYIANIKQIIINDYNNNDTVQVDNLLFCNNFSHDDIIKNPIRQYKSDNIKYGTMPVLLRQRAKKSTINNMHDISGNLEIDRNLLVSLSTKTNTITFFTILSILLILLLVICMTFIFHVPIFIYYLSTTAFILICIIFFILSIISKIKYHL